MDLVLNLFSAAASVGLAVAFVLLRGTLKNLLPDYFSQKGKNYATKEDIEELTRLAEKAKNLATKEDIGGITNALEGAKKWHAAELAEVQSRLSAELTRTLEEERRRRQVGEDSYRAGVSYWLTVSKATVASPLDAVHTRDAIQRYRAEFRSFQQAALLTLGVLPDGDPVRDAASDMLTAAIEADAKLHWIHLDSLKTMAAIEEADRRQAKAEEALSHAQALGEPASIDRAYAAILAAIDEGRRALDNGGKAATPFTNDEFAALSVYLFRVAEKLVKAPPGRLTDGIGRSLMEAAIREAQSDATESARREPQPNSTTGTP